MAAESFLPIEQVQLYCRFCLKTQPAQLDRSIAGNGRTVDRDATFEYCCSKCAKTFCYSGNDLLEQKKVTEGNLEKREYSPKDQYLIGEEITHAKFKDTGLIVGKDRGTPSRILVQFKKHGFTRLVEKI
jgi:hypothetical protein